MGMLIEKLRRWKAMLGTNGTEGNTSIRPVVKNRLKSKQKVFPTSQVWIEYELSVFSII